MPVRLEHVGTATPTTLATGVDDSADTLTLTSGTGYPTGVVGKFVLTLDAGTGAEEHVLATLRVGNVVSGVTRGWDGTTATSHGPSASVAHTFSATEADEANLGALSADATAAAATAAIAAVAAAGTAGAATVAAALVASMPKGTLGYAQTTASQGSIGTSAVDLTGLTATVTVGTGRRVRVSFAGQFNASAAAMFFEVEVFDGATQVQTARVNVAASDRHFTTVSVVLTPTAGTHTYKVSAQTNTGTVTLGASSVQPAHLLVEDIGV